MNRQSLQHVRQSSIGTAALADAREHLAQLSLDFVSGVAVLLERHFAEANESAVAVLWGRFGRRPATLVEVGEHVLLLPPGMMSMLSGSYM